MKEAIEFLESEKPSNFTGRELQNVRSEEIKEEKLKQVIALLKRGEAYEKIVEGFKEIFYTNPHNWVTKEYYANEIKKLEQKYFPKEAKQ